MKLNKDEIVVVENKVSDIINHRFPLYTFSGEQEGSLIDALEFLRRLRTIVSGDYYNNPVPFVLNDIVKVAYNIVKVIHDDHLYKNVWTDKDLLVLVAAYDYLIVFYRRWRIFPK